MSRRTSSNVTLADQIECICCAEPFSLEAIKDNGKRIEAVCPRCQTNNHNWHLAINPPLLSLKPFPSDFANRQFNKLIRWIGTYPLVMPSAVITLVFTWLAILDRSDPDLEPGLWGLLLLCTILGGILPVSSILTRWQISLKEYRQHKHLAKEIAGWWGRLLAHQRSGVFQVMVFVIIIPVTIFLSLLIINSVFDLLRDEDQALMDEAATLVDELEEFTGKLESSDLFIGTDVQQDAIATLESIKELGNALSEADENQLTLLMQDVNDLTSQMAAFTDKVNDSTADRIAQQNALKNIKELTNTLQEEVSPEVGNRAANKDLNNRPPRVSFSYLWTWFKRVGITTIFAVMLSIAAVNLRIRHVEATLAPPIYCNVSKMTRVALQELGTTLKISSDDIKEIHWRDAQRNATGGLILRGIRNGATLHENGHRIRKTDLYTINTDPWVRPQDIQIKDGPLERI